MNRDIKAYVAEFIGTFTLVFLGCGAVWAASQPGYTAGPIVPAFAHGLAIVFAAYALGHFSGAHLNPSVTIAVAIAGAISWVKAAIYIVVQIVAAIVAAAVLNFILGGNAAAQFGAFSFDASKHNSMGIFFLEMIMAFLLSTVVLQAAVRGKAGNLAGLAIGLTLVGLILGGGAISGASVNPARTLGPAIVAGNLNQVVFYVAGTVIGAALAALVSTQLLGMKDDGEPSIARKNTGRRHE